MGEKPVLFETSQLGHLASDALIELGSVLSSHHKGDSGAVTVACLGDMALIITILAKG